jgi:hypothetical protein
MRSIRIGAFAAVAAFVVASAAQAEDAPAWKDGWTSFKPGSSVTMKISMKMSMPGMPEQPPTETRQTLVSVTDKEYVVKTETNMMGTWSGQDMTFPRKATGEGMDVKPPPVEELGEEKVSVEGTDYATKKTKIVSNGATVITWTSKEHGALKVETNGPDVKSTMVVTALAKKVTVAGKEVACKEMKTTATMAGSETSTVFLSSEAVPGGMVRMETTANNSGMNISTVTEVTAFEAK